MKKKLIALTGIALILTMGLAACAPAKAASSSDTETAGTEPAAATQTSEVKGDTIMLYDYDGNAVDIFADGKPVYLKAWASWCPTCLAGLGELDALFAEQPSFKVVTIVAPGVFGEKSEDEFKHWLAGLADEYPNVQVLFDRDGDMMYSLGIQAFPTSYYFDSEGNLVSTSIGHNENEVINAKMAEIQ
jgi:thiol-disulfide isomerase/thioredoxin